MRLEIRYSKEIREMAHSQPHFTGMAVGFSFGYTWNLHRDLVVSLQRTPAMEYINFGAVVFGLWNVNRCSRDHADE